MSNAADVLKGPAGYALAIGVAGVVAYLLWDKISGAVGGVVSGNNAITKSARTDAYQGAGILGTLGAATDNASGGLLSRMGETMGGWLYDATHSVDNAGASYDASTGLQTAAKTVAQAGDWNAAVWQTWSAPPELRRN